MGYRTTQGFVEGMLRRGRTVADTAEASTWTAAEVESVALAIFACTVPGCGKPKSVVGRPKTGWIRTHLAGDVLDPWFCSWRCVGRYVARKAATERYATRRVQPQP